MNLKIQFLKAKKKKSHLPETTNFLDEENIF